MKLRVSDRYRHYKGGLYEIVTLAKDSETTDDMVVYRALYGQGQVWVRSQAMFCETVCIDGVQKPRFAVVDNEDDNKFCSNDERVS